MISVFNETGKESFHVMDKNSNFFRLVNNTKAALHLEINYGTEEGMINKANLAMAALSGANAAVAELYPGNTNVIFSHKANEPFVRGGRKGNRDIMLVSLEMKDREMKSFYIDNAMVYDGFYEAGSHLEFVCSAPYEESSITIVTVDAERAYHYRIVSDRKTGNIRVFTRSCMLDSIPAKGEKGHINTTDYMKGRTSYRMQKYRPSRMTAACVIMDPVETLSDEQALEKISLTQRIQATQIVLKRDAAGMDALSEANYTAVTVKVPETYTGDLRDAAEDPTILAFLEEAKKRFRNVMLIDNDFKYVRRVKVA